MTDAVNKPTPSQDSELAKRGRPVAAAGPVEKAYAEGKADGGENAGANHKTGEKLGQAGREVIDTAVSGAKKAGEVVEGIAEGGFAGIWGKIKGIFENTNGGGLAGGLLGAFLAWVVGGFFGGEGMIGTVISALLIPAGFMLGRQFGNDHINKWMDQFTGGGKDGQQPEQARGHAQVLQPAKPLPMAPNYQEAARALGRTPARGAQILQESTGQWVDENNVTQQIYDAGQAMRGGKNSPVYDPAGGSEPTYHFTLPPAPATARTR